MSPCRDSDVLHVVIPRGDTLRTCCNSERRYDTLHTARGTDETGIEGSERRDDVYYYNCQRLKLEGETENMCVWTKKRGSMKAVVLFYLVTTRLNQCRESSNKWTMPSLQLMMMTFITISARD